MERTFTSMGKVSAKVIEATLTGAIDGVLDLFGEKAFDLMIKNNYYIIESIMYAAKQKPNYRAVSGMSPQLAVKVEVHRQKMTKMALGVLGMIRAFTSRLPPKLVEQYLTTERFKKWMREKYPNLYKIVEKYGERGERWLENQVQEIKRFLLGRRQ